MEGGKTSTGSMLSSLLSLVLRADMYRCVVAAILFSLSITATSQQNPGKAVQDRLAEQNHLYKTLADREKSNKALQSVEVVDRALLNDLHLFLIPELEHAREDVDHTDFDRASRRLDGTAASLKAMAAIIDEDSGVSYAVVEKESKNDDLPDLPQASFPSTLNGRMKRALIYNQLGYVRRYADRVLGSTRGSSRPDCINARIYLADAENKASDIHGPSWDRAEPFVLQEQLANVGQQTRQYFRLVEQKLIHLDYERSHDMLREAYIHLQALESACK